MKNLANSSPSQCTGTYVASSEKTQLMEGQTEQALIRCRAFCTAADQSLDLLSHVSICRKHFSHLPHNLKTIYKLNEFMEKAYLGKH